MCLEFTETEASIMTAKLRAIKSHSSNELHGHRDLVRV